MASKRYGVRTLEWKKHLRKCFGIAQAQEHLVREDGKKQCRDAGSIQRGYTRYGPANQNNK